MIQPIKENLLVRLKAREEISKGGIHIPETAQETEEWGVVESVGTEVRDLSENDVVFIRSSSGTHYIESGVDYVIVNEGQVLAKIAE